MIKNSIGSNEFQGLARSTKGKNKIEGPTVKAPKFNKKAKQKLTGIVFFSQKTPSNSFLVICSIFRAVR